MRLSRPMPGPFLTGWDTERDTMKASKQMIRDYIKELMDAEEKAEFIPTEVEIAIQMLEDKIYDILIECRGIGIVKACKVAQAATKAMTGTWDIVFSPPSIVCLFVCMHYHSTMFFDVMLINL